jgi:Spy/CpxP family protein refolding chaperone
MKLIFLIPVLAAHVAAAATFDLASLNRTNLVSPDIVRAHASELGFSAEQESALKTLADEAKSKIEALEAAVREQKQLLEDVVKDSDVKTEAATAQLGKLIEAESALKHLQLTKLLELRALLTPAQRAQAFELARKESQTREPVEARIKSKAAALRAAWTQLAIEPPEALTAKGAAIEQLARDGKTDEADKALDALIAETGLNAPVADTAIDFTKFETGSTDLETLKSRYESVGARAKELTSLPTLRLLLKGRDELEKAKAAEDAEGVARILTWAEGILATAK